MQPNRILSDSLKHNPPLLVQDQGADRNSGGSKLDSSKKASSFFGQFLWAECRVCRECRMGWRRGQYGAFFRACVGDRCPVRQQHQSETSVRCRTLCIRRIKDKPSFRNSCEAAACGPIMQSWLRVKPSIAQCQRRQHHQIQNGGGQQATENHNRHGTFDFAACLPCPNRQRQQT